MELEFREIFDMSCEKGVKAIIEEVQSQTPEKLYEFTEELSKKHNHYDRVFSVFLYQKQYWKNAKIFFHSDNLTHWRKLNNIDYFSIPKECHEIDKLKNLEKLRLYVK